MNEYFFILSLPYQTGYIFVQGVDVYIIREMTLESEYSFGALVDNQAVMWKNTSNIILKEDNNQDRTAYQKITIDDDGSYYEAELYETTEGNRTILLPKTKRGKPKKMNYTATLSFYPFGVYFSFPHNK